MRTTETEVVRRCGGGAASKKIIERKLCVVQSKIPLKQHVVVLWCIGYMLVGDFLMEDLPDVAVVAWPACYLTRPGGRSFRQNHLTVFQNSLKSKQIGAERCEACFRN